MKFTSTKISKSLAKRALGIERHVSTTPTIKTAVLEADADRKREFYKEHGKIKDILPRDWYDALPYKSIPGPKPVKVLGNIWHFLPYVGEYHGLPWIEALRKLHKRYGDIVKLGDIPGKPEMIFLYHPDDFVKVYRNEGVWPIRDHLLPFKYYRSNTRQDVFQGVGGLTTMQGEEWYKVRTLINPIIMNPRHAELYLPSINTITSEFCEIIRKLAKENKKSEMPETFFNNISNWSLESIGVIALDSRLGCFENKIKPNTQVLIDAMPQMFKALYDLEVQPSVWKYISTPTWNRFVKLMDTITYTVLDILKESNQRNNAAINTTDSVLDALLRKNEKFALAMVMDMLMAGIDTTTKSLAAGLYFLATNKRAQHKLRNELVNLQPDKNQPITTDILENAHYLKAVMKETLRLAPIAVGNTRTLTKDLTLSNYQIPKGTQILCNHFTACTNDKYIPKSREFIPERFLRSTTGSVSMKNCHPFVYQPFGFGSRSCIGKRLALLEMEVGFSKIIRNFDISWPYGPAAFGSTYLYGIESPLKFHVKEIDH